MSEISKLMGSYVMIEKDDFDSQLTTTKSGIIVKTNSEVRPRLFIGTVMKASDMDCYFDKSTKISNLLPVGSKVVYYSPAVREIKINDKSYHLVRLEDIYAIVEED